jgi:osmotically-inducible protein OsmY
MNIDEELRLTVIDALRANPMIDSKKIGVAVEERVVTLSGQVSGYYQKHLAEKTAGQVSGIRGIAEEIEVDLPGSHDRADTDLAQAAIHSLLWDITVPESIQIKVEKGWITLSGHVQWPYQKQSAENAVRRLTGLRGLYNQVEVKQEATMAKIKTQIEETLKLAAEREAKRIKIAVNDGVVTLTGIVQGWSEKNDAVRAAWATPGVSQVDNFLEVGV